jgi:hypothetical protein
MNRPFWIIQGAVSLFFLYAGISKILDPAAFSLAIERYQLVGPTLSWGVALWLPWLECLAVLCLWIRNWRQAGLVILIGMVLVFQIALLSALIRGLDISCGCFGSGLESGVLFAFIRNFFLLGGIFFITFRQPRAA